MVLGRLLNRLQAKQSLTAGDRHKKIAEMRAAAKEKERLEHAAMGKMEFEEQLHQVLKWRQQRKPFHEWPDWAQRIDAAARLVQRNWRDKINKKYKSDLMGALDGALEAAGVALPEGPAMVKTEWGWSWVQVASEATEKAAKIKPRKKKPKRQSATADSSDSSEHEISEEEEEEEEAEEEERTPPAFKPRGASSSPARQRTTTVPRKSVDRVREIRDNGKAPVNREGHRAAPSARRLVPDGPAPSPPREYTQPPPRAGGLKSRQIVRNEEEPPALAPETSEKKLPVKPPPQPTVSRKQEEHWEPPVLPEKEEYKRVKNLKYDPVVAKKVTEARDMVLGARNDFYKWKDNFWKPNMERGEHAGAGSDTHAFSVAGFAKWTTIMKIRLLGLAGQKHGAQDRKSGTVGVAQVLSQVSGILDLEHIEEAMKAFEEIGKLTRDGLNVNEKLVDEVDFWLNFILTRLNNYLGEETKGRLKSARQPVFSHILPDDHPSLQYCKLKPKKKAGDSVSSDKAAPSPAESRNNSSRGLVPPPTPGQNDDFHVMRHRKSATDTGSNASEERPALLLDSFISRSVGRAGTSGGETRLPQVHYSDESTSRRSSMDRGSRPLPDPRRRSLDKPRDSGTMLSGGLLVTGNKTKDEDSDLLLVQESSKSFTSGYGSYGMVQASSQSITASGYQRSLVRPGESLEAVFPWGTAAPVSSSPDRRRSIDTACGPSKSLHSPWNDHMSTGNLENLGKGSQQRSFRHSFDVVQRPEPMVSVTRASTSQGVPSKASRPSTSQGIVPPRASKASTSQGVVPARASRTSTSQGADVSSSSWYAVPPSTMELQEERSHENLMSSLSSLRHNSKNNLVHRPGPVPANQWFGASGTDCAQQSFSTASRPTMQLNPASPSRGTGSVRRTSIDAASDMRRSVSDGHQLLGNFELSSSTLRTSNDKLQTQSHRQLRIVSPQPDASAGAGGSKLLGRSSAAQSQKVLHRVSWDEDAREGRDPRRASMDSGTRSTRGGSSRRISLDSHDRKPGGIQNRGSPLRQPPNSFIDSFSTSQSRVT